MDLEYKKINSINNKNNQNFKIILKHYKFTQEDALNLLAIRDIAIKNSDMLLRGFYEFIFEFDHAKMFLHNKDIINRHQEGIKQWFINLFCGEYDEVYFAKLNIISEVHVNIGLPAHYVNTAFSYVRDFIKDVLIKQKHYDSLRAVDKIIDINLDILTIAYREEEQTKLVEDIVLLKNSVENSDIEPYAQGIFDTKTLKLSKYECLMRLIDRKNNKVHSVFAYLNTSKKIKIYKDMMQIMIEKSINMFCGKGIEFSINLSYEDIENEVFRDYIYKKIKNCPSSKNIIFEILESDFIEDFTIVESFASKVRESGCQIAIDDFGSGFSSMENILNLKPDIIKIDGSLIKNIHTSLESRTIVKNIVNMAKDLNAKTVAEYVHSKEVLEIVQELEVDFAQGFYLAEPKAYDNLEY
ncbi:MAG: EAL domain-containing protein [Poseidonibacter sp.]|uniref:EAL domain-containing protein n=1 Tax=Poseidonibacter sp. TaxID=2321188 RepID=UPI00359EECA2